MAIKNDASLISLEAETNAGDLPFPQPWADMFQQNFGVILLAAAESAADGIDQNNFAADRFR